MQGKQTLAVDWWVTGSTFFSAALHITSASMFLSLCFLMSTGHPEREMPSKMCLCSDTVGCRSAPHLLVPAAGCPSEGAPAKLVAESRI